MTAVVELCEIFLYKLLTFELILGIEDIRWAGGGGFPDGSARPRADLRRIPAIRGRGGPARTAKDNRDQDQIAARTCCS
jgi:hypothetical protein